MQTGENSLIMEARIAYHSNSYT